MANTSYTKKTLIHNESIIFAGKLHGFCYVPPVVMVLVGLAMMFMNEIIDEAGKMHDEYQQENPEQEEYEIVYDETGKPIGKRKIQKDSTILSDVGFYFDKMIQYFPPEVRHYAKKANNVRQLIIGFILIVVGCFAFLNAFIKKISTEMAITTKKIIYKKGFISVDEIEMPLNNIEGVKVIQTVFDRMINRGTILINGLGMEQIEIPKVGDPAKFRHASYTAMSKFGERK